MRKRLFSPLIFFTQLTALVLSPLSYADTLPEAHTLTIHGSNTIGAKLAPALISGYLQSLGAKNIRQQESGENESQITATFAPDAGNNANKAVINIAAHGSGKRLNPNELEFSGATDWTTLGIVQLQRACNERNFFTSFKGFYF